MSYKEGQVLKYISSSTWRLTNLSNAGPRPGSSNSSKYVLLLSVNCSYNGYRFKYILFNKFHNAYFIELVVWDFHFKKLLYE